MLKRGKCKRIHKTHWMWQKVTQQFLLYSIENIYCIIQSLKWSLGIILLKQHLARQENVKSTFSQSLPLKTFIREAVKQLTVFTCREARSHVQTVSHHLTVSNIHMLYTSIIMPAQNAATKRKKQQQWREEKGWNPFVVCQ